ncbi:hypothetical protein DOTSEDRAFT_74784 [Dothistroma septosporum NZE10]|uniref:Hpc2-related domain-containing protein n=1 Tax=Dothistroma septosporum (strain NZE10 / CBS 128990) TaxID=675120 RepID=N1PD63_DOTSN|nr:hypothetical protein DOTSEDRAFT_74784 [Dothistroma septosporum NZE10]
MTSQPPPMDHDRASESSSISSAPSSPAQPHIDEIAVTPRYPQSGNLASGGGVVRSTSASSAQPSAAQTTTSANGSTDPPAKLRKQRKPREPKAAGDEKPKEKKPRKPREPKVKKEIDAAPAPRKRQKTEDKSTPAPADAPARARQSTLTEMVNQFQAPAQPASATTQQLPLQMQHTLSTQARQHHSPASNISMIRSSVPPHTQMHTSNPPTPRPYSSGQNYDPIRGAIDPAPPRAVANGVPSAQHSPHINRASASPSIISLIDPPPATKISAPPMSYSPQTIVQQPYQPQPPPFVNQQSQNSPTPPRAVPDALPSSATQPSPVPKPIPTMDGVMDVEGPSCASKKPPEVKISSKASSSAPTPKPTQAKLHSSPKGAGSGLVSSSDLFGGPSAGQDSERKGVDIEIRITLDPSGGNTINMAQEIAKKYGRDAINPRAAIHRQRLLEVAAAANKLEGGSADDMSVDLMSEADGDSNVEMGGMEEDGLEGQTTAEGKPRKRRKKVEEYDKEDDFIDDTELAWQEQAAVAKDGFFVYSGPLVPEGQSAQVESLTSTRGSRGGRGRGRGRGAAAVGTTHASLAAEKKDPNAPTTRGRGRARGTGAPRKPRITKADRERMEAEKMDRERMAGGPPPSLAPSNSNPSIPTTTTHQAPPPPQQTLYSNAPDSAQQSVRV